MCLAKVRMATLNCCRSCAPGWQQEAQKQEQESRQFSTCKVCRCMHYKTETCLGAPAEAAKFKIINTNFCKIELQ